MSQYNNRNLTIYENEKSSRITKCRQMDSVQLFNTSKMSLRWFAVVTESYCYVQFLDFNDEVKFFALKGKKASEIVWCHIQLPV